jgi:hypothetical protein
VTSDVVVRLGAGDVVTPQAFSGATANLLGGMGGYGQTRCEMTWLSD